MIYPLAGEEETRYLSVTASDSRILQAFSKIYRAAKCFVLPARQAILRAMELFCDEQIDYKEVLEILDEKFRERNIRNAGQMWTYLSSVKRFRDDTRLFYETGQEGRIQLLTAHDSKGKEFPVVLVYGVDDFDKVRVKENALRIIRDDLRRKTRSGVVGTGAMSDPYNPFERELELSRHALELCDAFGFGAAIATKSSLLSRDIDILQSIAEHSPVLLKITITTARDDLAEKIEPNVSRPTERFEMIEKLARAGLYTGILLMPVLPFIEDNRENIGEIIRKAEDTGVKFIYPAFGMTLRGNQRAWYFQKLNEQFPGEGLVAAYRKRYGEYYECTSPQARKLWEYFSEECQKRQIVYRMEDIISQYKRPYKVTQITLPF